MRVQSVRACGPLILLLGCLSLEAEDQAFVGARLIDGTGKAPMEKAVIVVRAGHIEAAGASVKVPAGMRQTDLTGKTVIPGLINTHGHVGDISQLGLYA